MAPNDYDDDDLSEDEEDDMEEEVAAPKKKRAGSKKNSTKPKRNMSAFFLYSQGFRAQVKEENPEVSFGDIARILSKQFKELSPSEKKKWDKKAEKDKARYQEEMKTWVPDEDEEPTGKRSKKAKKDPNLPKRNMSAYFLYSVEIRPTVKEENPEAGFGDIAKIISSQYKALSDSERKKWDDRAIADKARYERAMESYKNSH